jgi:hypothetical protein
VLTVTRFSGDQNVSFAAAPLPRDAGRATGHTTAITLYVHPAYTCGDRLNYVAAIALSAQGIRTNGKSAMMATQVLDFAILPSLSTTIRQILIAR